MTAKPKNKLEVSWLFETSALKISPAQSPFWYTSGLIGPYYINTHYLCGGEKEALAILEFIDAESKDRTSFPAAIVSRLEQVYAKSEIYSAVVDALAAAAREEFPAEQIDFISGGERRDWFFAPLVAKQLGISCIYLYNDLSAIDEFGRKIDAMPGKRVMNIADLLTVGSSYSKKWIPAVRERGGSLSWSLNVVDRNEGAVKNLREHGIEKCHSLFVIGRGLFDQALSGGFINASQFDLALSYLERPFDSMRDFLKTNPGFIEDAKSSGDAKKRERCELMIRENLYKL